MLLVAGHYDRLRLQLRLSTDVDDAAFGGVFHRHLSAKSGQHPFAVVAGGRLLDHHGHARRVEARQRSEEHTSELQSLMRISYAVFCLKKKKVTNAQNQRSKCNS